MLRTMRSLYDYQIHALDGEIGRVHEFFFHDDAWDVKYVVVNTGAWFFGKHVLVSPEAVRKVEWSSQSINVNLKKEQVEKSPEIDIDMPVSQQQLTKLHEYYGWNAYVAGGANGFVPFVSIPPEVPEDEQQALAAAEKHWDTHLRSSRHVVGYHIQATDEEIGHVDDFILDDERWLIKYLVIDTGRIFPGRRVLVAPKWATAINWGQRRVFVDLMKDAIRNSPVFDATQPVNREYEIRLYDYYGRPMDLQSERNP